MRTILLLSFCLLMLTAFGQNKERKANSNQNKTIVLKETYIPIQLSPRKDKEIDLSLDNKIQRIAIHTNGCNVGCRIVKVKYELNTLLLFDMIDYGPNVNYSNEFKVQILF